MTPNHIMPESEKSQRLSKVRSLIQSKTFSDDKLVYSFVLDLRRNDEIDEYIDFVKHLIAHDDEYKVIRSKEYIRHLFSEMYDVPCDNKKGYYNIKVLELLLVLSGIDPNENRLNLCTVSASQVDLAKRVASYMADSRDNRMTVALLSQKFHVSATHLQNAFKGVFGVPVFSYMRIHRMNAAALQLVRTNKTVMEIASESGYDNASKFASAFREVMSETPLEYRKSHRLARTE